MIFYLLSVAVSFFGGGLLAAMTGAAKDQGLAAGAIVLVYCAIASVAGLTISLISAYFASSKVIRILNLILLLSFSGMVLYLFLNKS